MLTCETDQFTGQQALQRTWRATTNAGNGTFIEHALVLQAVLYVYNTPALVKATVTAAYRKKTELHLKNDQLLCSYYRELYRRFAQQARAGDL